MNTKLTIAYKVVQVVDGAMWSVNITPLVGGTQFFKNGHKRVLQYKLQHIVTSENGSPLFVCPTLADARKALDFYSAHKRYILRGYATGIKVITPETHNSHMSHVYIIIPDGFTSALCDSFIPMGIVAKSTRH